MQFYVIHPDPVENAKLLPDYAIKNVNVREGWQILSDIGHAHKVYFFGQNKEYNRFHPNTWRWWKNKIIFADFINFYEACLKEYKKRFKKETVWHKNYYSSETISALYKIVREIKFYTEEQHIANYLLERKIQHLSVEEIQRLKEILDD